MSNKRVKNEKIRTKACELAALVLAGTVKRKDKLMPIGWSLAVFFEEYIRHGAKATHKDFGPKKPVKLRRVK